MTGQRNNPAVGIAFMIGSMFLFAAMDAISRHITQTYAIGQILAIRFVLFTAFAIILVGPWRVRATFRTTNLKLQIVRGLILIAEVGIFVVAFRYLPLADVHSVAAAAPLVVVALAGPLLGERVGIHRWVAVIAGFVGVLIIMRPGFKELDLLVLLPVGAMLLWGVLQLVSRLVGRYDGPNTTLMYSTIIALVISLALGPWHWRSPDLDGWTWLVLASVAGAGAHYFLIRAMDAAEASVMQPFSYTLVLWATLMGWLAFGEFPDGWTIAGGVVIVLAGLYALYRERRRKNAPS